VNAPVSTRWTRAPLVVFAGVELFAFVLWLHASRNNWFSRDDWDFLANRKAGNLGDLFRSHNGHWVTLPVLAYRFLYWIFGIRFYLPYRLLVIVLYLTAAALVLVVMRRAGANPWIATAAATQLALFGPGWENIIRPFQITFTGSLVFGFAHLLLADHDGPFDRRDRFALCAGFLGLMTSGVAVAMTIVVGIATLWRRGPRIAFLHTAPLGMAYIAWLAVIGRVNAYTVGPLHRSLRRPTGAAPGFVLSGLRTIFRYMSPAAVLTFVPVAALVIGLALALRDRRRRGQVGQLAAPISLLAGSVIFLAIASTANRGRADQPHYVSIAMALALPALAVALTALVAHRRWLVPIPIVLLVVVIPHEVSIATSVQPLLNQLNAWSRHALLAISRDPQARNAPPWVRPEPLVADWVTIGWLLGATARNRVPAPTVTEPNDIAANEFRLSFNEELFRGQGTNCRALSDGTTVNLRKGDVIRLNGHAVWFKPPPPVRLLPPFIYPPADDVVGVVLRDVGAVSLNRMAFFSTSWTDHPPQICTGTSP
jgi:hypothetical protein